MTAPTPWWRRDAALFALVAAVFALLNRAAFKAWFHEDDLENFNLSHYLSPGEMAGKLLTPRFIVGNYRPVGEFWYRWTYDLFGAYYPAWVLVLWLIHLSTTALLWRFLRRTGVSTPFAAAGCLVFAVHGMTFPAHWQPMFVFDTLCAFWTIATLLCWQARRPVLAFLAFWLAYKSKEPAVAIPAVLLAYEYTLGQRRWRWTLPFFLTAVSFTIQGYLGTKNLDMAGYTLQLTPTAIGECIRWYGDRMLLVPLGGLVLLAVALWRRTPLLLFGALSAWLLLGPLLALPGRKLPVYLYTASLGLAIAAAALLQWQPRTVAALLVLWLPWNYAQMRSLRNPILELAFENPPYVQAILQQFPGLRPAPSVVVFDGWPRTCDIWGTRGIVRFASGDKGLRVLRTTDEGAAAALQQPDAYLMRWESVPRRLTLLHRDSIRASVHYLDLADPRGLLVLDRGWYNREAGCAWTQGEAQVSLHQPAGPAALQLRYNVGPGQERYQQHTTVLLGGQPVITLPVTGTGIQARQAPVAGTTGRPVTITIRTAPTFVPDNGDDRHLGLQVCGVGFLPDGAPQ